MKNLVWVFLGLCPVEAAAQEDPEFSIGATLVCLDTADDFAAQRACVGSGAVACMESHPAGYSTLGQGYCLTGEWEYWDARLNEVYRALRAEDRQDDIDMDAANNPGMTSQAETLQAMQRAWIPFRDATCEYERAQWSGGTGGGPASANCMMYMTAEQALYLESMRGGL